MGQKPKETQQSQYIFRDALNRVADEPHPPGHQVGLPAERVVQCAVDFKRQGIDCQVTARRIGFPVIGEGDRGMAAVGFDIMP